jgi:hypothetical protein
MAKTGLTLTVHITGLRETLAKFRGLPKEASDALRTWSQELAGTLAESARAAGIRQGRQAALVATTVKARRDRVPSVQAGGSTRLGRYGAPAYALLFGSEFGMNSHSGWYHKPWFADSAGFQYHPHTGQQGAWFFPTVERESGQIADAWNNAATDIIEWFGE